MSNFWKIFISVVVTFLVVGGGVFYVMQKQINNIQNSNQAKMDDLSKQIATLKSTSSATTTPATTNETAGWKTYTNTTYGFSFKYPADYNLADASTFSANDGVFVDSSSTGGFEQPHLMSVEAEKTSLTLDAYLAKSTKDNSISQSSKITFSGQPAYEGVSQGLTTTYAILVKYGDYIYHFYLESGNKDALAQNKAGLTAIQNNILSAFQFTPVK